MPLVLHTRDGEWRHEAKPKKVPASSPSATATPFIDPALLDSPPKASPVEPIGDVDYTCVMNWINQGHNDFAKSLKSQYIKKGTLSPAQINAVKKIIMQEKAGLNVEFDLVAKINKGLLKKKTTLTIEGTPITVSAAKPASTNPGALYLKDGDSYMGKITSGGTVKLIGGVDAESVSKIGAALQKLHSSWRLLNG